MPTNIKIGLWNIQDLGGGPGRGKRQGLALQNIANEIKTLDCDVVGILELKTRHYVKREGENPNNDEMTLWLTCCDAVFTYAYRRFASDVCKALSPSNGKSKGVDFPKVDDGNLKKYAHLVARKFLEDKALPHEQDLDVHLANFFWNKFVWPTQRANVASQSGGSNGMIVDNNVDDSKTNDSEMIDRSKDNAKVATTRFDLSSLKHEWESNIFWRAFDALVNAKFQEYAEKALLDGELRWMLACTFAVGKTEWHASDKVVEEVATKGNNHVQKQMLQSRVISRLMSLLGVTIWKDLKRVKLIDPGKVLQRSYDNTVDVAAKGDAENWEEAADRLRKWGRYVSAWRAADADEDMVADGLSKHGFEEFLEIVKGLGPRYAYWPKDADECLNAERFGECVGLIFDKIKLVAMNDVGRASGFHYRCTYAFPLRVQGSNDSMQLILYHAPSNTKNNAPYRTHDLQHMNAEAKRLVEGQSNVAKQWPVVLMADLNIPTDELTDKDSEIPNAGGLKAFHVFAPWAGTEVPLKDIYTSYKKSVNDNNGWSHAFDKILMWQGLNTNATLGTVISPGNPQNNGELERRRAMSDHCHLTAEITFA